MEFENGNVEKGVHFKHRHVSGSSVSWKIVWPGGEESQSSE